MIRFVAPVGAWRKIKLPDSIHKHCTGAECLRNAFEIAAQACSVAIRRSKSLLECAP